MVCSSEFVRLGASTVFSIKSSLLWSVSVICLTSSNLYAEGLSLTNFERGATSVQQLSQALKSKLETHSPDGSISAFVLPDSNDYSRIPADPANPITREKVKLGQFLFHDTAVGTETAAPDRVETYGCATCHHAAAGFKSGITQGLGDGGWGFANDGKRRRLAKGLDPDAPDGDPLKPDFQPVTSPTVLNTAYQQVMLWNGALGSAPDSVNADAANLINAGPPGLSVNNFGLQGLESQVLAGTVVHRLRFDNESVLQTNRRYKTLYRKAYPDGNTGFIPPGSRVTPEWLGAAKAIAAFERTVLANKSPFQKWLRGGSNAMTEKQLKGANLFFGKANCVACHTGPALSSLPGAAEEDVFFNIGFADLDTSSPKNFGTVPADVMKGRGHFSGKSEFDFAFKIPQLYNLADAKVFGHGGSFKSVRQVLKYKNRAVPQTANVSTLAAEFTPLGLSRSELRDLEAFILGALYDPRLSRYQPKSVPSGNCFSAADIKSAIDLRCW